MRNSRLSRWAQRNQCDEPYQQEDLFDNDVHHLSWTCGGQEGVIQHYKTDDQSMSHHFLLQFLVQDLCD